MKIEKRLDGSVTIRGSGTMRIVLFLLGAAVVAGVFVQQPRDYAKVCLGVLGSLIPFTLAAVLDQTCFDFDASQRRVRWRRTNLVRSLSGELSFDEISDVFLRARLETQSDSARRRTYSVYRVVLATSAGDLPLSNSWVADERGQSRVAGAIRAALGKSSSRPVESDIERLVAAGHRIDAVQLARVRLGLSLTELRRQPAPEDADDGCLLLHEHGSSTPYGTPTGRGSDLPSFASEPRRWPRLLEICYHDRCKEHRSTTKSSSQDEARDQIDTSMMAWRVHEFGPPEAMRFERVPQPVPGPGEILVEVHAAGVGPWDGWVRAGRSVLPQPLPLTLGSDLSGEIQTVGIEVPDLRIGDRVYGVTNPRFVGAYAEYALASAAMIARKPTSLTYIEAASVPVIAVTAWQGLFDQAQLEAGQTVVIHGAAGNVGAYAVQLARRAGIRTIATVGTDDIAFVRDLGADTVIDFRTQRFEDAARNVDAVLDLVGGETQRRSFQVLRRGGKLISAVSNPDQNVAKSHGVDASFFLVKVTSRYLTEIADLIDGGKLRTRVGAVLPLADAREAHLILDGRRPSPKGKIVLSVETR